MLKELRNGRLKASASETTLFKMEIGEKVSPAEFGVDMQTILDWMANPKTPEYLVEKVSQGLVRKPQ
jgi:hypothetical protein